MSKIEQRISNCLWFDDQAEEAVRFYTSVFSNSSTGETTHYDEASAQASGQPLGSVLTMTFAVEGYEFMALNGGPMFKFTPSISFIVHCGSADKVDGLWAQLSDGGEALMPLDRYPFSERYGWVQDKYGVTWQLILTQGDVKQTIMPSLLFVGEVCGRAEEAINFYTSVFKGSRIGQIHRYGAGQEPEEEGTVMFADFEIEGQPFAAMDSAQDHQFNFNEAISFVVNCDTQEEIDHYWEELSSVPDAEQCGWLKDPFGVSWQIVPVQLPELLSDPDPEVSRRAMEAMLTMTKLDIEELEKAREG